MIKSFGNALAGDLYNATPNRQLPSRLHRLGMRKLRYLDNAANLNDLRVPPGNRLEKLAGDRKGQCSIRINDQSRICFRWQSGDAHDVTIVDYR